MSTIKQTVEKLHTTFKSGKTRNISWRKDQLQQLHRMLEEQRDEIKSVLKQDLGHKSPFFADVIEIEGIIGEIKIALKGIDEWVKDRPVTTPLLMQPGSSFIRPEPKGVITIIAPWNYPIQLALMPLIASISAGNCAVIKPSEVTPSCSTFLKKHLEKYLDSDAVAVIEGAVPETTELLKQKVDHIFYTGNGLVGKIVMKAAAEHLAGVTLELGGKSPVFVADDADIEVSAKRILWGKFMNCGQTCVAPDYIMVQKSVKKKLIDALIKNVKKFYGDSPKESADYARIVNSRHTERLAKTLNATIEKGAHIEIGGEYNVEERFVAPTIFSDVTFDSPIMSEENFGPLLPIIEIDSFDQGIDYINNHDHPLALYIFSSNTQTRDYIVNRTQAGGTCFNDTVVHVGNPFLPFGGTGPSGTGSYHSVWGFNNLSHFRSIISKGTGIDLELRYPPYTTSKLSQFSTLRNLKITTPMIVGAAAVGLGLGGYGLYALGADQVIRGALVSGLTFALDYLK